MNKIFVYGTLKKHHPNFKIISSGVFCGVGRLPKSNNFRMVSMGSFPALIQAGNNTPQEINGEIWDVDDDVFKNVDYLEGYPTFYNRDKYIILDSKDNEHTCWTYFLPEDKHTDQLKNVQGGLWLGYKDSLYGSGDFIDGIRDAI